MRMRACRGRTGQATLEYLLILAVVIAAVAIAAGTFGPAVGSNLDDAGAAIGNAATQLDGLVK